MSVTKSQVKKVIKRLFKTYGHIAPLGVNCYYCDCGHATKTIDIHAGVTPFMFRCEKCSLLARSSFYKDIAPGTEPTIEFYRPGEDELLIIKRKDRLTYDHICDGGLISRKINKDGDIQNGRESVQGTSPATKD